MLNVPKNIHMSDGFLIGGVRHRTSLRKQVCESCCASESLSIIYKLTAGVDQWQLPANNQTTLIIKPDR